MKPPSPPQPHLLHELLQEDQEPFLLQTFIADRRSQRANHDSPGHISDQDLLHIPSATAAILLEAAIRIQNHKQSTRSLTCSKTGSEFFSSLFKTLGYKRTKSNNNGVCIFSFHKISSSVSPPELRSPIKHIQEDEKKKKCEQRQSKKIGEEEENGKEQNSPVSTLEPLFDEDVGNDTLLTHESDFDASTYDNLERLKQELLSRIYRFEKLAQLDAEELEKQAGKLLEEGYSDIEKETRQTTQHANPKVREGSYARIKLRCSFEKLDLWKNVEELMTNTVMILDFKHGECREMKEEIAGELALQIYEILVEELLGED